MENAKEAILGRGGSCSELSISGISSYQPFDGLMDLKVVYFYDFISIFFVFFGFSWIMHVILSVSWLESVV